MSESPTPNETHEQFVQRVSASNPVFLWAPTARCGITLLQRLITSTRDVLIYGENRFLAQWCPDLLMAMGQDDDDGEKDRARLVAGDYNFWSSRAFPRIDMYRRSCLSSFFQHLDCYDQCTKLDGFQRWGIKTPGANPNVAYRIVHGLLPNSQHVFIYRGLEDVLKSYKARKWLEDLNAVAKVTALWVKNIADMETMKNDANLLMVQYEELIRSPERESKVLTDFLGIRAADLSIFDHKVNTFAGDPSEGRHPSQYIAPEELTDQEREVMTQVARQFSQQMDRPITA